MEWSRDLILRRLKEVGVDLEGKIEVEAFTDPDAWESEYNLQVILREGMPAGSLRNIF